MLQDIRPHRLDISFHPAAPGPKSRALVFDRDQLLAAVHRDQLALPRVADCTGAERATFLFRLDETDFFLLPAPAAAAGFSMQPVALLRTAGPKETAFAALTGYQLYKWYRDNRYCGRCGGPLIPLAGERALRCDRCGNTVYPRIAPVVIVGVTDGDRLLMTRYAGGDYRDWALVAGFVEVGETPEDAARREVLEETGVQIRDLRYVAAQPWAFSESLLLGFFARLEGPAALTVQRSELAEAAWIPRAEIHHRPEDFSLTGELIDRFVRGELPWK